MIRYLEAPNYEPIYDKEGVVFLAGPITGAPNWQPEAVNLLKQYSESDYVIANPRRGSYTDNKEFFEYDFNEQVDWELKHLYYAEQRGIILFWLCKEEAPHPGRAYAQTSRFELGFFGRHNPNVYVGIEPGFSGEKYLRYMLPRYSNCLPIKDSLEQLCRDTAYRMDTWFK